MSVNSIFKRLLAVCAFIVWMTATTPASAQIFLDPPRYSTPGYDSGIVVADFNRDGNWDVAAIGDDLNVPYLSVFLGKPDGTFQTRVDYALINFSTSIAVGDFNGDGYSDLAVTSLGFDSFCHADRGYLSIFINKGDGTFRPRVDYGVAGCVPTGAVVGDFNNDGKLDVANVDGVGPNLQQPGDVGLFLGNGDGTFQAPVPFSTGPDPAALVAGDFNGDNNLDLAVSNIGNGLGHPLASVLLGNGDGTFQAHVDFGNPTTAGVGNIVVADFNRDGKADLAVAADQASIFLGNGDGTFQNQIDIQDAGLLGSLMVGDFNGDGVPDLIGGYNGDMAVLIGRGDGSFIIGDIYGWPVVSGAAVDFNKDGKMDLIASSGSFDAVGVLLGNGDGTFPAARDFLLLGEGNVVADFNLDGKPDVATTNAIMLGNGDGTFRPPVTYFSGNLDFFSVTAGDFNNDGKPDLVVGTYNIPTETSSLFIFLGNGNGTFKSPLNYTVPPSPFSVASADFNGDHKLDLVATGAPNNDGVVVLLGKGDGTFQSPVQYETAQAPLRVAVGDLRGNGKQDLLVATVCPPSGCNGDNTGSLSVLLSKGDGTFQRHIDYALSCSPNAISTGNLSGDGLLDVAVDCPDVINIFLGNGDGTLQPPLQYPHSAVYGSTVVVGDFNGDGNTDLAISSRGYTVALLLGNGDGTFQAEQDYVIGGSATSAMGDFNGDGKPDIVSGGIVLINIANFPTFPLSVSLAGSGAGAVSSNPAGINCGNTCSANFVSGVSVTLTATSSPGSIFASWSGDCSGAGTCTVTMNAAKNVTATFNLMPDFSISASALSPSSVSPGQSATSTIQIAALNGFSGAVSLTCSVSPAPQFAPQCSISPNSVTPGTPATLTVTTTAPNLSAYPMGHAGLLYAAWLPAFGLTLGAGLAPRRQKKSARRKLLVCCLTIVTLIFLAACGGGSSSNHGFQGSSGTAPGSYTITVTGTSGGLVHSTTVTLTVQ